MMIKRLLKSGFSLVEVNLAVALIGLGMLSLFSLFPMGLRESEYSITDTHEAMFADHVLNAIRANAMDVTSWSDWQNHAVFNAEVTQFVVGDLPIPVSPVAGSDPPIYVGENSGIGGGVYFPDEPFSPDHAPRKMRYKLTIGNAKDIDGNEKYNLKRIELWVKSGEYGDFDSNCSIFFAEVPYMGM